MSKVKQKNKIRKSTKYTCIIIAIVLIVFSLSNLLNNLSKENMKKTTKEIYNYKNTFKYDYKVNLQENRYITEKQLQDKNLVYVTDLIDNVDLKLNYTYNGSKDSNLKYTYSIIGKTRVVYTKDGKEQKILDEDEVLLEEQTGSVNSDKVEISKTINLDLKKKNELLNEFKQKMGMSIDAKYTVYLKTNVSTTIENENVNSTYTSTVDIDLAEKTTEINGDNNKEDIQYISKEYEVNIAQNNMLIFVDIVCLIIAIVLLKYVSGFRTANRVKDEFRLELNRILKICQDKIVQVSTRPVDTQENIVNVKDFGEIFKVSEELFKPILYYFDDEEQEALFSVVTGNVVYRFILKK